MKIDYEAYYNEDYYNHRKTYRDELGRQQRYIAPSLTWDGFDLVANGLHRLYPKVNSIFDIGCSAGDLVTRLAKRQPAGDPWGCDVSKYAVDNCVPAMQNRVFQCDITTTPPLPEHFPKEYDLVMSTDLLEHIYLEDLDRTFDWILSLGKKHFFFLVCTTLYDHEIFVHKKGEEIPPKWEGIAAAGHINIQKPFWWWKFFESKGLRIDWQRNYLFQMDREQNKDWKNTGGWNMPMTVFLEKK